MKKDRDTYHRLLATSAWRRLRRAQLEREPFCADCRREGVLTPAQEVHHALPVAGERDPQRMRRLALDPMNLVSLCRECHRRRHLAMGKGTAAENARRATEEAAVFARRFYGSDPGGLFSEAPGGG